MRKYWLFAISIVLIMTWHLVLSEPFKSGIVCVPTENDCRIRVTRTINPFTDVLTVRAPSPSQFGITDPVVAASFRASFTSSAQSSGEDQLRHYARKYFDLYAMLLPYSVTVESEETTTAAKVEPGEAKVKREEAIAKWPEVRTAEQRLFGKRTDEVDSLGVMSETVQGTLVVSTRCMAHFCSNHSAMWIVDLSTGRAAGEIASDGMMDRSGKAELVVCLGDYENSDALPSVLQGDIKSTLTEYPQISISYVHQIQ